MYMTLGNPRLKLMGRRAESIKKDFTPDDGKPLWPLSSYGPAKGEKTLLTGLDESPEELRLMAWQAFRSQDPMQLEGYKTYEANKITAALTAYKNAEMNSMDAFKAAFEASRTSSSVFGEDRQATSAPAFGQPSSSPFGQPSSSPFGQFSTTSAFSQPKPVFGQPSAFNLPSAASSAFGQPPATTGSAFGPGGVGSGKSNFGLGQSTFGQSSSPFSKSAGQPVFGQVGFAQPVFGQTTRPSAFSTSGASAPAATTPVFGQPTFNQSSTSGSPSTSLATGFSAFTQPQQNQPQSQTGSSGGFGAFAGKSATFSQPTSAFGAPSAASTSVSGIPTDPPPAYSFSSTPRSPFPSTSNTAALTRPNFQPSNYSASNDPYAATLPENYKEIIPKKALEAFESAEFSWGYIPEWIPPISLR